VAAVWCESLVPGWVRVEHPQVDLDASSREAASAHSALSKCNSTCTAHSPPTALGAPHPGLTGASIDCMRLTLTNALRFASVPVGVGVGIWTAQLESLQRCPPYARCPTPADLVLQPTFTAWQCALFGAGAAVVLLVLSFAVARPPSARSFTAA
jgi:hypothetical protein